MLLNAPIHNPLMRIEPLALLSLALLGLALAARLSRRPLARRWGMAAILLVGAATVMVVVSRLIEYAVILRHGPLDPWNHNIAAIAAAWLRGQPMYPLPTDGLYYGLLYGPLLYRVLAAMQALFSIGTPLAALPGMVAEAASLIITWYAVRRGGASRGAALFATAATAGLILRIYPSVGFRADPFLLLLSSLGLLAMTWAPNVGRAVMLGLCAGLATALKPSGGLYLGPALLAALPTRTPAAASRYIVLTGIAGLAGALLPFVGAGASPAGYLAYLAALKPVGVHGEMLMENSIMALLMLAPALFISPAERRARGAMLAGLCLCMPVTCVLGAVDGAGVWHLLPFVPYTTLLVGVAATAQPGWNPRTLGQTLVILLIMADGASHAANETVKTGTKAPQAERVHQAVVDFLSHHPDAAVAIAPRSRQLNREVAWLVGQGKPLILTSNSWIDLGKPEAIQLFIDRYLSRCDGLHWLGMANPPFSPDRATPAAVSVAFMALYHRQSRGEELEVWSCAPAPDEPPM
ncbi:hypothetical protein D3877_00800 [Azospirillum cavernae]|uniref:Glycosyltransferase RgtA/B/C/D-like domain-containing protein n=1 Tax=Azospirillum cavernae TaxID=2320860 RepID=A0A418VZS1_9PROT|nr:hypothetical protein [Azospirillum cavernae]RJF83270.1 hypothetical protein D3877_00800 [Azospirillum cavernae]